MGRNMSKSIRLLICDDHAVVRRGLRAIVGDRPNMKLVGEAKDGQEAVAMAKSLKPDVIIMDLIMPGKDGVTAIAEIKKKKNEAMILVLTSFSDDKNVFSAIKAGASGYLLKDATPEEILQAINDVSEGRSSLHPVIARKVIQEMHHPQDLAPKDESLSRRELEVLTYVAQGMSNQEIAQTLGIKEGTVRIHVGNILNKLQLANRTQATLYALRQGLAELEAN